MLRTDSLQSPMAATTDPQPLQRLAQQLQVHMRSLPDVTPIQIQCVVKQENLMVLGQHSPDSAPDPHTVFGALEQAIQTLLPTFGNVALGLDATVTQAKLYLRKLGERQPYASHSFELLPAQEPLLVTETAEPEVEGSEAGLDLESSDRTADNADNNDDDAEAHVTTTDSITTGSITTDSIYDSSYVERSDLTQLNSEREAPLDHDLDRPARSSLLPWLIAGVGVSVAGFAAGLWVMSRPCVWGTCEPLQTAQALSQQSAQTMQGAKSGQDLQQAQQQLTEATRLLQSIPVWSSHHGEAQALQQDYQAQTQVLDRVLIAEAKATTATQTSQTLPQPVVGLQSAQTLWREAIAQLQTIPQDSNLYPFAQQRLTVYEANRAAIDKLTLAEQQAQKKLATAKETVKVAEARQGIAQTPENWQLAHVTWQVAVNTLQQISNSTTSYTEAQQLLSDYQPKLTAARDRAMKEQIAKKAFTQALALAQRAEAAQNKNQWSQAVANWREALTNVKQVPDSTTYSEPAQPLIASYSTALKQAEVQLQAAAVIQQTRNDLNRICAGTPRTCTYAIANSTIRVQFTPTYERKLRTAFIVGRSGDYGTLGGAVNHIETLQTALQTVANNANLPLEVYSADGSELIGSFNPQG